MASWSCLFAPIFPMCQTRAVQTSDMSSTEMADPTPASIIDFAAAQAIKEWEDKARPYLLARLSPDLAARGIDYRAVLGEQKLKDFVRTSDKLKVIVHPHQKSKIGLIPPEQDYTFPEEAEAPDPSAPSQQPRERSTASRRRYVVTNFLQLLSELDDAEAAQVVIPTNILTKLMRER